MPKTWGELKDETLKLMFSYSSNGAEVTKGNEDYILAMAEAANYALRDLAINCRPIVRKYCISHNPVKNMLGDSRPRFDTVQSEGADIVYGALDPKAFYFEADNPCTVLLERVTDGVASNIQTYVHSQKGAFTPYRGRISLPGAIRLRFAGGTGYNIRNVAFYAVSFPSDADVPAFALSDRYNLKALIGASFYRLPPGGVVVTGDGAHRRNDEFMWEDDCTFVVDHYAKGQYEIFYHAYPAKISAPDAERSITGTPDSFLLELDDEALDLAPLYMAYRLYLDDDPGKATAWLNQYGARRAELSGDKQPIGTSQWRNETGWW